MGGRRVHYRLVPCRDLSTMAGVKGVSRLLLLALAMFTVALTSCGKVDRSDAEEVAEAFWIAVDQGDFEEAALYVREEDRESFHGDMVPQLQRMLKDTPRPDPLEVEVNVNGDHGETSFKGWHFDLDIRRENGEWWISKH